MIFFDVDETLVNNRSAEYAAAMDFHRSYAHLFPVSSADFATHWQKTTEKHVQRYLSSELSFQGQRRERLREIFARHCRLSDSEADLLFAEYLKSYEKNWALFPDVPACLDRLHGTELGIISNGQSAQQRQKLAATGIIDRFSVVVISEEIGAAKPDPKIFLEACRIANVDPSECWHIGDNLHADFHGSVSAGLNGLWLNRSGTHSHEEKRTLRSLSELDRFI